MYKESWVHLVKDKFAQASILLPVDWTPLDFLPGILFFVGIGFSFYFINKIKFAEHLSFHAILLSLVLISATLTIVPKIEHHSQRPAIDFFKKLKNKNVYVFPVGYKSYAHWYYFEVPNSKNDIRKNEETLLYGNLDKPVYFITKINCDFLDNKPELVEKISQKGGFKFYKRIN
jgi:hypothetical protein